VLIAGFLLFFVAITLRSASANRFVRARLTVSCGLFAIYVAAAAFVVFGRPPAGVIEEIQTANPLLLAFGLANAFVVLAINPWREDRIPERFPHIVQDAMVIGLFGLAAMLFLPEKVVATTFRRVVMADAPILERISAAVATRRAEQDRHRETKSAADIPPETTQTLLNRVRQSLRLSV